MGLNRDILNELGMRLKQYKEALERYREADHPDTADFDMYCDKMEIVLSRTLKQVLLTQYLPTTPFKTAKQAKQYVIEQFGPQLYSRFDMTPNQLKLLMNAAIFDLQRTKFGKLCSLIDVMVGVE